MNRFGRTMPGEYAARTGFVTAVTGLLWAAGLGRVPFTGIGAHPLRSLLPLGPETGR